MPVVDVDGVVVRVVVVVLVVVVLVVVLVVVVEVGGVGGGQSATEGSGIQLVGVGDDHDGPFLAVLELLGRRVTVPSNPRREWLSVQIGLFPV